MKSKPRSWTQTKARCRCFPPMQVLLLRPGRAGDGRDGDGALRAAPALVQGHGHSSGSAGGTRTHSPPHLPHTCTRAQPRSAQPKQYLPLRRACGLGVSGYICLHVTRYTCTSQYKDRARTCNFSMEIFISASPRMYKTKPKSLQELTELEAP